MESILSTIKSALPFLLPYMIAGLLLYFIICEVSLFATVYKSSSLIIKVLVILSIVALAAIMIALVITGHQEVERRWFNE